MPRSTEPNFSIPYPENGKCDSFLRIAKEYGLECRMYTEGNQVRLGLWEKFQFDSL